MTAPPSPRLSARALIIQDGKLLLVNATPDGGDGRWCAPGGGVDNGEPLKDSLKREINEETGLQIDVHDLCFTSEYFDTDANFHQVDLFFSCSITDGSLDHGWEDVSGVVQERGFFTKEEIKPLTVHPSFLKEKAWIGERNDSAVYMGCEYRDKEKETA